MNFVDFGALPRYSDAYLPSPVRKSVGIRKMQEKFGSTGADGDDKPATRNFRSYRDIEKPPFEVLESPAKKSITSSNDAPQSPTGRKNYRSLDSPRSIMFPMDSPVPTATYKSTVPSSPVRSTFAARAAIPRPPVLLGGIVDAPKSPKTPSKKQTVKKTVSFDKAASTGAAVGARSYPSWDYGKKKTFPRPPSNLRTNRAATTIQRLVRGGMQRLHYRVAKLERMLDTRDQRTDDAKAKIRHEFEQRKVTLRLKLEQESKKETRKQQQIRTTAEEAQKLVAYLRRENKRLREKNQEIHLAIVDLKQQNERLETANSVTDGTIGSLNDHAKTIEDTHAKLMEVIPKYQETIGTLSEAVQLRRQYGNAEHKIRVLYVKLMGDIVEHLEGSSTEFALAEEAMQSILELEEQELAENRPVNPDEYLGASSSAGLGFDGSDGVDDDDDDDLNNYRVHTMD